MSWPSASSTHLDVGDRIAALFDVSDLRGGVFGRAVHHSDGNHGGKTTRDAARVEKIETGLIAGVLVEIGRFVPRVHR